MKLQGFLLCLLLGMCLVVGIAFFSYEAPNSQGELHSTFPSTMQEGGSGQERHGHIRWLGWSFAMLQLCFYVGCLAFGVKNAIKRKWAYLAGSAIYIAVFSSMVLADYYYAERGLNTFVLSLPVPTAIMLYGVWSVPVVFIVFYVWKFDHWILTDDDIKRLNEVATKPSREASE